MGSSTADVIINEMCDVLWDVLTPLVLKYPDQETWKKSAEIFGQKLSFPNCCGAMDGKHIQIKAPAHSGSMYFNYLKTNSVVLLAICDANRNFLYVDIGAYGGQSDGGVLSQSSFGQRLDKNQLHFPQPTPLPGSNTAAFPYFIIADAAFPLEKNILKPYGGFNLSAMEAYYNNRLNSVRKVIENTFGILAQRWRIFFGPIQASPVNVDKYIKAAVVLHNFIKSYKNDVAERYVTVDTTSENTSFVNIQFGPQNSETNAKNIRNAYAEYLFQHRYDWLL